MPVNVTFKPWNGWKTCCWIDNGNTTLIITTEVGPRILHYALNNGTNLMNVYAPDSGQTDGDTFRLYGGHRFWVAPEHTTRTYYPDNHPVQTEQHGQTVRFIAPEEATNGLQKTVAVTLARSGSGVEVQHTLTNTGDAPIQAAPWALTVMAPGGRAILPLPPRAPHPEALLPVNNLTLWAYTDLSDPRWHLTDRYVMLQQQGGDVQPQKIGASAPDGWLGYVLSDTLFIKQAAYSPGPYPDMNSSAELFTNDWMLELETLGHLNEIAPGDAVTHTEQWSLHPGVPTPHTADDIDRYIAPLLMG